MSYRMQAVKLQELQFQSAVRDQVITEQRGVIDNLWRVIEGAGISKEEVERIGRKRGVLIEGLAGWPSGTRQKGTRPGTTSTGGVLGGLFRTIRGAGNRAHLRYDFWRRKERGEPIEEDEGEADDDERSALGDTAHGHGILGGIIQTIKNKFFGTKAGKPVKGEQAVSTFKVAVAPAPAPLPQLPSPKF